MTGIWMSVSTQRYRMSQHVFSMLARYMFTATCPSFALSHFFPNYPLMIVSRGNRLNTWSSTSNTSAREQHWFGSLRSDLNDSIYYLSDPYDLSYLSDPSD
mgnify:CR=1 FL=1